jgi:hypothetical protein
MNAGNWKPTLDLYVRDDGGAVTREGQPPRSRADHVSMPEKI